jgi:TIR domain-containing protein/pentapeptide repeat protein
MSDVFISYASEDRRCAGAIANGLTAQGWSVWWDRDLPAGRRFSDVIQEEISNARCILVVWSAVSVKKDWVIDEASEGQKRGILVPVFLEPLLPPLGFRQIQAADLSDWRGDCSDAAFRTLCRDIAAVLSSGSPAMKSLHPDADSGAVRTQAGVDSGPRGIESRLQQLASAISVHDPASSRRYLQEFRSLALSQSADALRDHAVNVLKGRLGFVATEEGAPAAVRLLRQEIFGGIKVLAKSLGSCFASGELEGMDLYGFDFSGTDMRNVSFRGGFLVEANFMEANLDQADLSGCCVRNAKFSGTSLAGANFTAADWFNALGLTEKQLAAASPHTVMACPGSVKGMKAFLKSKYGFPMETWAPQLQDHLRGAWQEYLGDGGLCSAVARWKC